MSDPGLTAVVLTLNEERHLPGCLESLRGLTERVIVVDSGSTDRTCSIGADSGADVIYSPFTGFASQRNRALDLTRETEWILFLDADERLTEGSRAEIRTRFTSACDGIAGFWIPRQNISFGRRLKGGGWWPDYQARLIRRGRGRYDETCEVHEVIMFDGATDFLLEPIVHINYDSRLEFMRKQREYTLRQVKGGCVEPPRLRSYVSRPAREFFRRYVLLRGYQDGLTGLFLAAVMALEELRLCFLSRGTVAV